MILLYFLKNRILLQLNNNSFFILYFLDNLIMVFKELFNFIKGFMCSIEDLYVHF